MPSHRRQPHVPRHSLHNRREQLKSPVGLLLATAALVGGASGAWAQATLATPAPSAALQGPWKLIAPFPPGGPVDSLARLIATGLKAGKLKPIGLTDSQRSPAAPDIPTLAEQGISGVVVPSWYALLAPASQGLVLWPMTPQQLDAHIRAETARWARWAQIIKSRKITAE